MDVALVRIFILEDDPARMLWFREFFLNHDITHAESCTHITRFQPPYDAVFFDHDLGGRQLEDHEDCGEAFARLIPPMAWRQVSTVIIHSYNPDGAERIFNLLWDETQGRVVRAPFRGRMFTALCERLRAVWRIN